MNSNLKKSLNILSYLLNAFFIFCIVLGLLQNKNSDSEKNIESIKQYIIERETSELPLKIQEYNKVHEITIKDVVITNDCEPYSGYMITNWDLDEVQRNLSLGQVAANGYADKYIRKQKEVYVELRHIMSSRGKTVWVSDWDSAFRAVNHN